MITVKQLFEIVRDELTVTFYGKSKDPDIDTLTATIKSFYKEDYSDLSDEDASAIVTQISGSDSPYAHLEVYAIAYYPDSFCDQVTRYTGNK